jgi:hypothetical protein
MMSGLLSLPRAIFARGKDGGEDGERENAGALIG